AQVDVLNVLFFDSLEDIVGHVVSPLFHPGPGRADPKTQIRSLASDRLIAGLAGTNTNDFRNLGDEYLSIADLASLSGFGDGSDGGVELVIAHHDLDLQFWQEVHDVFGAAIKLGVTALSAKSLDLKYRHALEADGVQGLFHLIEFERLNDRLNLLHLVSLR